MKKLLLLIVTFAVLANVAFAQTATIAGTVKDADSQEALVGATIRLLKDSVMVAGAYTDDAGAYSVEVAPGNYTLVCTYISYDNKTIDNIQLTAGQSLVQDVVMGMDVNDAGDKNIVVIMDKVVKNNEATLINMQRRSTSVVDVISLEQVQRTGDQDAGAAMKRVTGVTVEGGKYVYVRGLGDRYTKTLLNGSEIPSLDPNRNSVQMDLFPANLIDNIVVYKTFTPDLPGSFTGGLVKISTKDFPQKFSLSYNSSLGFNTSASFRNDFLTGQRGNTDWLGMDDGTRDLPAPLSNSGYILPDQSFADPVKADAIELATNAFSTPMTPEVSNSSLNHSHAFTIGDQKKLGGKPFGYVVGLSYNKTDNFFENAVEGRWQLVSNIDQSNGLNNQIYLTGDQASREVLWGGLVNFSWLPSVNHQLSFNYMHNQSGNSSARFLQGDLMRDDPNIVFQTRVISYTERALDMFQLKGDHTFGKLKADWIGAFSHSAQNEPDLRFFSNDYTREDTVYDIQRALYSAPSRYFRKMEENNLDGKVGFTLPFKQWSGRESKFQFGGAYTYKGREFYERRFEYVNGSPQTIHYEGNPAAYFGEENLGVIGTDNNGLFQYGNYITDASELRNSYSGTQGIAAAHMMVDMPLIGELRMITGARMETTSIVLTSKDTHLDAATLNNLDILPSVNLIYAMRPQAMRNIMNLRGCYSRTLARPVFRELAPYASFDFVGDMVLIGNPDLQRTLIDNLDLRWELYPSTSELVSVSAFYKNFTNPIELVINPMAANIEGNYRNVPNASLVGVEFEFRKNLDFITPALKDLRASGNITLIKSRLDISPDELEQIRSLNPNAESTRAMFGQSPYSLNGELAYTNDSIGFNTSMSFNVFGPRIAAVSRGGTPNVYEQPRPTLDFSVGKRFGPIDIRFRARNLLDPEYKKVQTLKNVDYIFSSYRIGRTFSLGVTYTIQ
ncbi:MAG: carboxypeptidase regulatory-like domain-containing protein [Bacteroidia bacterium]|nr:carboxypeptidase regulatory-like domain-containing protein [Bacteroidia bacterium]